MGDLQSAKSTTMSRLSRKSAADKIEFSPMMEKMKSSLRFGDTKNFLPRIAQAYTEDAAFGKKA